jgi:heptosyltransferase-1
MKHAAFTTGMNGIVALVHGSSRADKQWPLAHWRALTQRLNAAGFGVALPHGGGAEEQIAHQITEGLSQARVWPLLPLDVLTDALATCSGVIGVDSGLSHMAVALDLPHVQIYNFDTAWRTGPLPLASPRAAAPAVTPSPTGERLGWGLTRQLSVFAQPTPSVEAVWQAWESVSTAAIRHNP